jgi:hypothetical protein
MGEQIPAARGFLAQCLAERISVDGDQQQVGLARKVPGGGLPHLMFCRKVEVTILYIDGRSRKEICLFGAPPKNLGTYLVDSVHEKMSICTIIQEQPALDILSQ